jgi:hypothetical protein
VCSLVLLADGTPRVNGPILLGRSGVASLELHRAVWLGAWHVDEVGQGGGFSRSMGRVCAVSEAQTVQHRGKPD